MDKTLNNSKLEPEIGDIVKIICVKAGGMNKEVIGRLEGYQTNDFGIYIKLTNNQPIFADSVKHWEILRETKKEGE